MVYVGKELGLEAAGLFESRVQVPELLSPLCNFLLETGIGFLQVSGHPVEFFRKTFELVAGPNVDAVVQCPGANLSRSLAEYFHRTYNPAADEKTCHECHAKA